MKPKEIHQIGQFLIEFIKEYHQWQDNKSKGGFSE